MAMTQTVEMSPGGVVPVAVGGDVPDPPIHLDRFRRLHFTRNHQVELAFDQTQVAFPALPLVGPFVQVVFGKGFALPGLLADGVAGALGHLPRVAQCLRLLGRGKELHVCAQLHPGTVSSSQIDKKGDGVSSPAASHGLSTPCFL